MRFLIGLFFGLGAGYAIASAFSRRLEQQQRTYDYEPAVEQPVS